MVFVFQQIKILFLTCLGVFRRALCCFSRRRKPSVTDDTAVQVIVDKGYNTCQQQDRTSTHKQTTERDWNSWDDSPRTVEEHIEQYRQRIAKPPTPQREEPEPDFFSELAPVIQPQPKYYLGDENKDKTVDFSRLQAKTDVPITLNADLEDWIDEEQELGGWETLDSEQTKQLLRDKRRELRSQRQKTKHGIDATNPKQEYAGIAATRLQPIQSQQVQQHSKHNT